jgi:RNA polymerase sigma-70 factor, ECF subfamily
MRAVGAFQDSCTAGTVGRGLERGGGKWGAAMKNFPITAKPRVRASDPRMTARSFDDVGEENLAGSKAYLESRSRGVEPPPPLAEAWRRLYEFYAPRIRVFLRKCGLHDEDLKDCSQDVWKEVVAKLAHFHQDRTRAQLSTWIMTLARNKAVDSIRRRNRHISWPLDDNDAGAPPDPNPGPAAEYERRRTLVEVQSLLAELASQVSPTSFQVLYMRWIEGLPTAEVATALEITPQQVRFRSHRMKQKVRALLELSMDHDDPAGEPGRPKTGTKTQQARNKPPPSSE